MWGFLEEQIQNAFQRQQYGKLLQIIAFVLFLAAVKVLVASYIVQFIWNSILLSVLPFVKPVHISDIIALRIAYFAFLQIS